MLTDLKTYLVSMQKNQAEDPDESWINTPRARMDFDDAITKLIKDYKEGHK